MKHELPQRDLSLSLTSSPREETAMQPRLEALNSNSFQTIFCKTVNRYKERLFFVNGVPAAQESSDSRSAMQKLFASNEIDRARRQREYGRFQREIDAERRPMYPVSGHRNGAVDYTYMFAIDTKYNTAVADYTVVIQSTVNTLIPAGARVF